MSSPKNFAQHRHLRYWGLTSELQLKPKAKHKSWAGPDPQKNAVISNSQTLKASPTGRTYTTSLQQRKCSNVGGNFKRHPTSFKILMDTSGIDKINIEDEERYFYYHPLYTTLAFLITLPYYFGFGTLFYLCWTTHKTNLLFGFLAAFVLLSNPFLLIASAFVKLLFHKPAIVLTGKYFVDNWNNLKLNWTDIKQISSFNFRWSFICVNTINDKVVFRQILNPSKFLFMGLERLFSGRTLKINLSLLKDKNSYVVSTTKQFWRTKTATNIGIANSGAGNWSNQQR